MQVGVLEKRFNGVTGGFELLERVGFVKNVEKTHYIMDPGRLPTLPGVIAKMQSKLGSSAPASKINERISSSKCACCQRSNRISVHAIAANLNNTFAGKKRLDLHLEVGLEDQVVAMRASAHELEHDTVSGMNRKANLLVSQERTSPMPISDELALQTPTQGWILMIPSAPDRNGGKPFSLVTTRMVASKSPGLGHGCLRPVLLLLTASFVWYLSPGEHLCHSRTRRGGRRTKARKMRLANATDSSQTENKALMGDVAAEIRKARNRADIFRAIAKKEGVIPYAWALRCIHKLAKMPPDCIRNESLL
eukprot:jgi/Bigna1/67577/fgenesh1_pg.4_\